MSKFFHKKLLHIFLICVILIWNTDGPLPVVGTNVSEYKEELMMNATEIINAITKDQIRNDLPELEVGSTVKVYQKIVEGSRTRTQMFEGTVIKVQGGGIAKTFTVRRVSYGVGVEKTWPVNSPNLEKIEVVRKGKVRRARLYYLRDRVGKAAKVKERI